MIQRGDGIDLDPYLDKVNTVILERPGAIIIAVLLLTAVFATGIPMISTQSDQTEGFTEGIPEQQVFESVNEEFGNTFEDGQTGRTQITHVSLDATSKTAVLRSLKFAEALEERERFRIQSIQGPAQMVAMQIDPSAQTASEQRRAVEQSTSTEVDQAVRELSDNPAFTQTVSDDFNPSDPSATATMTTVTHDIPSGGGDELRSIQYGIESTAELAQGDFRVFGAEMLNAETQTVIQDSLLIVVPVVALMILIFLAVAYRDPIDMILSIIVLILTLIWTFGFMGHAGISFNQQMIAVPIILLAVGVDFGIHAVNRYREERETGSDPLDAMRESSDQILVAFFIVAATTVFGFGANVISTLEPTRNFGIVAAVGIIFTFVLFAVFMPAVKVAIDNSRDRFNIPSFGTDPIASEGSLLSRSLTGTVSLARIAPVLLVLSFTIIGGGAAMYGQGVDQSFDQEDFLPPEDLPGYIEGLPEPFAPSDYRASERSSYLEDNFEAGQTQTVILYVEGPFTQDHSLEAIAQRNDNPPDSFMTVDGEVQQSSIITEIQSHAQNDPEFAALVERSDTRGADGVPDKNLDRIYDELEAAETANADEYITDDRRAVKITYTADADADAEEITADAQEFADGFRKDATATGQVMVFQAVTDSLFQSAIQSLALAIGATLIFLIIVYGVLEGRPLLGVVNIFPILITVAVLVATMRAVGISLNALTGSILAITIGVGVAYSVHITHRFIDEYDVETGAETALHTTLRGTGGALTGSMLTTALGTGALVLAISQVLGNFGLLLGVSVVYSYAIALVALPPALLVWAVFDKKRLNAQ